MMKNFLFIVLISSVPLSLIAQEKTPYSKRMANSQIQRSGDITRWDYPNGLFVESVMKVYEFYKDETYFNYSLKHANATVNSNTGKIGTSFNFSDYNLDFINPGKFLFEVYKVQPYPHHKIALDTLRKQLQFQPRTNNTADGGFWHKKIYPHQMWLDGLFMGTRFYVAYEKEFNNGSKYDDIVNQFKLIHSKTYDEAYQLNYHAWSAMPSDANSFWANKTEPFLGCSKEFWGRGLGWYAAALVDVIEILPADYPRRAELITIFNQVAAGIKRWQDPSSGCWYQLLRYDSSFKSAKGRSNYIEASASSMFTYALLKALRLQIIEKEKYEATATKAYQGLLTNFITEDAKGQVSLNRICQSAGLGPSTNLSRDGSASYYLDGSDAGNIVSNDLKGVGPFIMASVEYERMHSTTGITTLIQNSGKFLIQESNGTIYICGTDKPINSIKLLNLNGQLVFSAKNITEISYTFTPQLDPGMYFIQINKKETSKLRFK